MSASRVCSECGAPLTSKSPRARTCSTKCRTARARRIRDERDTAKAATVRELVERHVPDEARIALREELRPVVREAIDEDVLKAIQAMVGLTPQAVEVLANDLGSDDPVLRQRAATLVVKYTVGHPALVKATEDKGPGLQVYIGLPRPEDVEAEAIDLPTEDVEDETRVCDVCGNEKLWPDEFESMSNRCKACFEERRAAILHSIT